jgi:AraC-like DNA-binding protein
MSRAFDTATTLSEHDSALGRWTIAQRRVHPALQGIVTQLWHGAGRVAYQRDRILPRTQSYLLINLGPPQYMVLRGEPEVRVAFDDIWFSGLSDQPIDTEAPHGNVLLGVAFTAVGAATLLRMPQHEIANWTGSFADVAGADAARLRQRLLDLADPAERLAAVEAWLLERCVSGARIHPLVAWAVQRIADSGGQMRTTAIARAAGCSRKHLASLFRERVGFAPKTLARIQRFHAVVADVGGAERVDWSEIASRFGYSDQSHLIHEFRQFAALTPGEYLACARPDGVSIVLR